MQSGIQKIFVMGNAGGGKTTLSRKLAAIHNLPLTHVDSIQFLPGMKIRPYKESIEILNQVQNQDAWIIDGYGPLDIIEKRFALAEVIVFIDMPLWRHLWWALKRQIKNLWSQRPELPEGCDEFSVAQTKKLLRTIWRAHHQMRPELLRILARDLHKKKVIYVRSLGDFERLSQDGIVITH